LVNSSGETDWGSAVYRYNTAVAGQNSIEKAAYFGEFYDMKLKRDNSGNILIFGVTDKGAAGDYRPEWSVNSISKYEDILDYTRHAFLIKTNYDLSTILYASPIGFNHPEIGSFYTFWHNNLKYLETVYIHQPG
jgi:hypothetical protein